ncbi:MAG: hypothetical protein P8N28_02380 [Phycisphaerales bacterium]|nr:hypothetical protein [Phycisphaerales bacterium]
MKKIGTLLLLATTNVAMAIPVELIHAKNATPIVPRGGVLMVPLIAETLGNDWPETIEVTLEGGQIITGHIGWVERLPRTSEWDSFSLHIRPVQREHNTANIHLKDNETGPVLLAQMPAKSEGTVSFGGDTVDPIWFDLPEVFPNLNLQPVDAAKTYSSKSSYADVLSYPLEHWRRSLLASKEGVFPSTNIPPNEVRKLASIHGTQLWRIGFDRLAKSSRGIAAECRDLLTMTCTDKSTTFACWVTAPSERLLTILLDKNASSRQLAARALNWCSKQQPFLFWLEKVYGEEVIVAVANPTLEVQLVALKWREGNDVPLLVDLQPNETTRITLQRVHTFDVSIFGPTTLGSAVQWLDIQIGNHAFGVPVVPSVVVALPPAVQLQPLFPQWSLESIKAQTPKKIPNSMATNVQLRKVLGQWEFFVECNGNSGPTQSILGGEGVSFQTPTNKRAVLRAHPNDDIPRGTPWSATIPIPEDWIVDDTIAFSVHRKHGESNQCETGPLPSLPWRRSSSPIVVDISQWDEVKRFPTHSELNNRLQKRIRPNTPTAPAGS